MPSWMSFLHDKMKNPSQDLFNVKLFIAKLIINASEVSSRCGLRHFVGFVTGFVLKSGISEWWWAVSLVFFCVFLLHKCKLYHVSWIYSFFTISSGMELLGQGWVYVGIILCFFFNPFAAPGHMTSLAKCFPSTYRMLFYYLNDCFKFLHIFNHTKFLKTVSLVCSALSGGWSWEETASVISLLVVKGLRDCGPH